MIPYIIQASDYYNGSAGIRNYHRLCRDLNNLGYKCYIIADVVNPEWNTPKYSDLNPRQRRILFSGPVNIIYSEVVRGNPLNGKRIIRYLQQYPGFLGGDTIFDKSVIVFSYSKDFMIPGQPEENILAGSIIELELFNLEGIGERDYETYYFGKMDWNNNIKRGIRESANVKIIKRLPTIPSTRKGVADLLKNSKILYCYDDLTVMIEEARLCGCPVVVYSNRFQREYYKNNPGGDGGIALDNTPEEIKYAKSTLNNFIENYKKIYEKYPEQLKHFVEVTQK